MPEKKWGMHRALIGARRRDARTENALIAARELSESKKNAKPAWNTRGSNLWSYDLTFGQILETSLWRLLKDHNQTHKQRWVLDLMADDAVASEMVDELNYSGGLAVTLGYESNRKHAYRNLGSRVETLKGDILKSTTWNDIEAWMGTQSAPSFDVILSRPLAGLRHITFDAATHLTLLRKAWSLLNPDGGILLFQVPIQTFEEFSSYANILKSLGINCIVGKRTKDIFGIFGVPALIRRMPLDPAKLPTAGKS